MGVKAKDFAVEVDKAYTEKWGYIWGQSGDTWTQVKQDNLEKKYNSDPNKYEDYELGAKFGSRWIGHRVADCSGLPYGVLKKMGVRIAHGSNTIWNDYLSHKGPIKSGMKLPIGAAVFTEKNGSKPHMGILTAEKTVTEAKTTQSGVVHTPISNKKWKYWGLLKKVEYDFIPGEEAKEPIPESVTLPITMDVTLPTLRKGDTRTEVATLQELLTNKGYSLPKYGVDGNFGSETLSAVKKFQKDHDLVVDGIVGPKTWKALMTDA